MHEPTKDDLAGQLIIFAVDHYEPNCRTKFGVKPKVTARLFVVTGPVSGEYFPAWSVVGPMAKQMAVYPRGAMMAARVVPRTSSAGHAYFTIDTEITLSDRQAARECLSWGLDGRGGVDG